MWVLTAVRDRAMHAPVILGPLTRKRGPAPARLMKDTKIRENPCFDKISRSIQQRSLVRTYSTNVQSRQAYSYVHININILLLQCFY
jgi:hypothetical protein